MNIQDALDLSLNEEAFRIIGKSRAMPIPSAMHARLRIRLMLAHGLNRQPDESKLFQNADAWRDPRCPHEPGNRDRGGRPLDAARRSAVVFVPRRSQEERPPFGQGV